jgi:predicted  nucleic acid-binding Zn-ribbon protein
VTKRDPEARKTLDRINQEAATHDSELRSVDDAIASATAKLAVAKQTEAKAADHAAARQLRKELQRFREHGAALDAALEAIATHGRGLQETLIAMQRPGEIGSTLPNRLMNADGLACA